jgi:hypothetical protein
LPVSWFEQQNMLGTENKPPDSGQIQAKYGFAQASQTKKLLQCNSRICAPGALGVGISHMIAHTPKRNAISAGRRAT